MRTQTKTQTQAPAQAPTQAPAGDLAAIAAAVAAGEDINKVMADLKAKALREKALAGRGVMTVEINRSMTIQTNNNGDRSVLCRVVGGKGIKAIKGSEEINAEEALVKLLAVNPDLQITVNISEALAEKINDKQSDLGNVSVELVLSSVVEFRSVQGRFDKNDPDVARRGKPMFKTEDGTLTEIETAIPFNILRLRATSTQALSWDKAQGRAEAMGELDDLIALATNAQVAQKRSLNNWSLNLEATRKATTTATNVAVDTSLAGLEEGAALLG